MLSKLQYTGRNTADEATSSSAADWHESPEGQNWAEALEDLDIAIAERRCSNAVQLLMKADGDCSHPQAIDWSDPDHQSRSAPASIPKTNMTDAGAGYLGQATCLVPTDHMWCAGMTDNALKGWTG